MHQNFLRFLFIIACATCSAVAAAKPCTGDASKDPGYMRAARKVQALPEYIAWSKAHRFPVAFGSMVDQKVVLRGKCLWSVTVYADMPERLDLWHVFYVTSAGHIYIEDN